MKRKKLLNLITGFILFMTILPYGVNAQGNRIGTTVKVYEVKELK